MGELRRIRVERIIMPPPVPAGMNPLVLMRLWHEFKATNNDDFPVKVRRAGRGLFTLTDGRHRLMAHHAAGRPRILAEIEE